MINKEKWEAGQMSVWKDMETEVVSFFSRFDCDIDNLYNYILSLGYNQAQSFNYLIGKIRKAISICDFLDKLKQERNEDVDKIKLFLLIAHSEIAMNTLGGSGTKADMVDKFFEPASSSLDNCFQLTIDSIKDIEIKGLTAPSASRILYKLRNEYAHEGNFTSQIFHRDQKESGDNLFGFNWDLIDRPSIYVTAICKITYKEFLDIYFRALVENISYYFKPVNPVASPPML